jgi:hypothetical protein
MSPLRRRPPRDATFLARLAAPLEPARPPYYVATPRAPGQLVGWYMELERGKPVALGANVYYAGHAIECRLHEAGLVAA